MSAIAWVLIDETAGQSKTADGSALTPAFLAHLVEACSAQLNGEFAREHGGAGTIRVGSGPNDVQPGERVYAFVGALPNAPGASAYHDINGQGVPVAFCAVTTCGSLYGSDGVSVDASHEILETGADEGCNQLADDGKGTLHAKEVCDPVETQTYGYTCADGTVVQLSNFVMRSWFDPNAAGPYDYMTSAGLAGAVAPPGPMQTAPSPGGQGNYQITCPSETSEETETFAETLPPGMNIEGRPRKLAKLAHWSSRFARRARARRTYDGAPSHADLYHAAMHAKAHARRKSGALMLAAGSFAAGLIAMDYVHDAESFRGFTSLFNKVPPELASKLAEVLAAIQAAVVTGQPGSAPPADPQPDAPPAPDAPAEEAPAP